MLRWASKAAIIGDATAKRGHPGTESEQEQHQEQQQGQQQHHHHHQEPSCPAGHNGGLVHLSSLLQLSPPKVEAEFWESEAPARLLWASDSICLGYSALAQFIVLAKRARQLAGQHKSTPLLYMYMCTSIIQLAVMLWRPQLHRRWRFKVTVLNRLLRLATHTAVCLTVWRESSDMGWPASNAQQWLRPLVGPSLLIVNHASFVLPFRWVLPAQLWTLTVTLVLAHACACTIAATPGLLVQSQRACVLTKQTMHALGMAFGTPPHAAAPAYSQECQGVAGLVTMGLYLYMLLLLVAPCFAIYLIELNLKVRFVAARGQHLCLRDTSAIMDSPLIQAVSAVAFVVGTFYVCEVLVAALQPSACSSAGRLVFGPV